MTTKRRAAGAVLLGAALASGSATLLTPAAHADDLSVQPTAAAWFDPTWQSAAQPAPPLPPDVTAYDLYLTGLPDAVTTVVANTPLAAPANPTSSSDDGYHVALAFAAIHITVPAGATAQTLSLDLGGALPVATLSTVMQPSPLACLTTSAWSGSGQETYASAPTYDCTRSSSAKLSTDGTQLQFNDIGRLQKGTTLDFVVITQDPVYQRLVVSVPAKDTLTLLDFGANQTTGLGDDATPPVYDPTTGASSTALPASGAPDASTNTDGAAGSSSGSESDGAGQVLAGGVPVGAAAPTSGLAGATGTADGLPTSAAPSLVQAMRHAFGRSYAIAGLVVLVMAGLWLLLTDGGPALLTGAVATTPLVARRRAEPADRTVMGIGRFRSVRDGAVPRL